MLIPETFKGIKLTDEQAAELKKFFEEYSKNVEQQISEELSSTESTPTEEHEILQEEFENYKAKVKEKFEEFKEHAKEANKAVVEEIQKEYSQNMAKALESLYSDIEDRVKKDFLESNEYKVLAHLKEVMKPIMSDKDTDHLLEEIETLRKEKEDLENENSELDRNVTIETLMKDFPEEYANEVREFIEASKSNEEIYERFNQIIAIFEKGGFKKKEVEEEIQEEEIQEEEESNSNAITEDGSEETIIDSTSDTEQAKEEETSYSGFTEEQEEMLRLINMA